MPYNKPPEKVKKKTDAKGSRQFVHVFNSTYAKDGDEARAFQNAWAAVRKSGHRKDQKDDKSEAKTAGLLPSFKAAEANEPSAAPPVIMDKKQNKPPGLAITDTGDNAGIGVSSPAPAQQGNQTGSTGPLETEDGEDMDEFTPIQSLDKWAGLLPSFKSAGTYTTPQDYFSGSPAAQSSMRAQPGTPQYPTGEPLADIANRAQTGTGLPSLYQGAQNKLPEAPKAPKIETPTTPPLPTFKSAGLYLSFIKQSNKKTSALQPSFANPVGVPGTPPAPATSSPRPVAGLNPPNTQPQTPQAASSNVPAKANTEKIHKSNSINKLLTN